MRTDVILGSLTALNLVAVVVVQMTTDSIPDVLAASLTVLIGATAGVAIPIRKNPNGTD